MLNQLKKKKFHDKKGKHVFAKDVNSVNCQKVCKLKGSVAVRGHCGNSSLLFRDWFKNL